MFQHNLRYPFYIEKYNEYSSIDYFDKDCNDIKQKLSALKEFLAHLNRL
jgi:Fe-S-cluster containining protein